MYGAGDKEKQHILCRYVQVCTIWFGMMPRARAAEPHVEPDRACQHHLGLLCPAVRFVVQAIRRGITASVVAESGFSDRM